MQKHLEKVEIKLEGASFWDANPCGGDWNSYNEFLAWIQTVESYAFNVLDGYEWIGTTVLDVGCGQGTLLNYLPQRGARVVGIDMSAKSLLRAYKGAIELEQVDKTLLSRSDAENLPFANNQFDLVISFGVLHHTPDTARGVEEIYRVLKPGGSAIVMLYRSGNPKWLATRAVRAFSHATDQISKKRKIAETRLRSRKGKNQDEGTALLELFGVPIMKAFSNRDAQQMFSAFREVQITNHQVGFRRLADISPLFKPFESVLTWFDRRMQHAWGFYQIIEALK